MTSCNTIAEEQGVPSPQVYAINAPSAGNYPQGLYKYPYKGKSLDDELFTQTLEWSPEVTKTFAADTQYTAIQIGRAHV